jgi:hypothetical protein
MYAYHNHSLKMRRVVAATPSEVRNVSIGVSGPGEVALDWALPADTGEITLVSSSQREWLTRETEILSASVVFAMLPSLCYSVTLPLCRSVRSAAAQPTHTQSQCCFWHYPLVSTDCGAKQVLPLQMLMTSQRSESRDRLLQTFRPTSS